LELSGSLGASAIQRIAGVRRERGRKGVAIVKESESSGID
jgi:hypothetical protein